MRKMVKRLLKKYKYPPEKYEDAIETVMSQCELWTDQAEMWDKKNIKGAIYILTNPSFPEYRWVCMSRNLKNWIFWSPFRPCEITENPWKHSVFKGFNELVGQNCNSVKSRILCLRFINIEIIPLNTVLVNRFLKSFCKIIETMSYYFLYLMYKYRLKRGKPILSLSFYATSIFRNSSSAW